MIARSFVSHRFSGLLLVLAFAFAGDLVRLHGHADDAPASSDCVACVAGLSAAVDAASGSGLPADVVAPVVDAAFAPRLSPDLPFVRHGGLRDPPLPLT